MAELKIDMDDNLYKVVFEGLYFEFPAGSLDFFYSQR